MQRTLVLSSLMLALGGAGLTGCATTAPAKPAPAARTPPKVASPVTPGTAPTLPAMRRPEAPALAEKGHVLLDTLEAELKRSMTELEARAKPVPYFMSYTVTDIEATVVSGSQGLLADTQSRHTRQLDVMVRVGDYKFDNFNPNRGGGGGFSSQTIVLDDDPEVMRRQIWRATEGTYRTAAQGFIRAQTNAKVSVREETVADDFSRETPVQSIAKPAVHVADTAVWENRVRKASAAFRSAPAFLGSTVRYIATTTNRYYVTSEGTKVQSGQNGYRVTVDGRLLAEDGMPLMRFESFEARGPEALPSEAELSAASTRLIGELRALEKAPVVEPWVGPVVMSGRAAAVFFHEILGHRLEGHRQRAEHSGQTFAKDLGVQIMPAFINVTDDATAMSFGDTELNGHYFFDDEGVKAQPVPLVEKGVLKRFLMGRQPIEGIAQSNGHGRKQPGRPTVARQGNLMVLPDKVVPADEVKTRLRAALKARGLPFGYLIDDISGGFTNTSRFGPQAFKVEPTMVWRVYADGRADELVRGVDVVGTPKTVLQKIIAAGDDFAVFNGVCGAESGWVPVSAVAPSLLFSEVEIEKKSKTATKRPILPAPPLDGPAASAPAASGPQAAPQTAPPAAQAALQATKATKAAERAAAPQADSTTRNVDAGGAQ